MRRLRFKSRESGKDNTNAGQKAAVRAYVLTILGVARPAVLDCYCGSGVMHRRVWGAVSSAYVGLDSKEFNDDRETILCDNARYLRMADLDRFDVFDLDAYGSAFYQFAIICRRLRWSRVKRVGIILTDGSGYNFKMNIAPSGLLDFLGLMRHRGASVQNESRDAITQMALRRAAGEAGARMEDPKIIKRSGGADVWYLGFVLAREA